MTLREITYDIIELLNAYSDDSRISEEHIEFMIGSKRALLLKQYLSNGKKEIPQESMQLICMPLEKDDTCFSSISVLKSKDKVPPTLDNTGRSNIAKAYGRGVRDIKNLNIIDYSRLPYAGRSCYTSSQIYLSLDPKSHLILYSPTNKHMLVESLEIEGVFEDPRKAYELSCDNNSVPFEDSDYPMEAAMLDPVKNLILQDLLNKYRIPMDIVNNGEDDIVVNTK